MREKLLRDIRRRLQDEAISGLSSLLDVPNPADLHKKVEAIVDRIIRAHGLAVTHDERLRLIEELVGEVGGLGPLEPLLVDETITEIMVNGPSHVYIERGGRGPARQRSSSTAAPCCASSTGSSPRSATGSTRRPARRRPASRRLALNAIIEPLSLVGPVTTVRKFAATQPFTWRRPHPLRHGDRQMFAFLQAWLEARLNLFVSGGRPRARRRS